jgi:hypothetical protein
MRVEGDKIYLNLPNAKVSDVVSVVDNGGYITDPRSGRQIRLEPEVVGQLKITAVRGVYAVGKVYGNITTELKATMTVRKDTSLPVNGYGEATVMIAPAELNFPQGINTMVGDGYIGDYVSATLMEHLLKSNKIQLLDRSMLDIQKREISMGQSGEIDYNTAIQYGRMAGARYIVKITMQKPDVAMVENNVPVGGLLDVIRSSTTKNSTNRTQQQLRQLVPENVQTIQIKVSVNIKTHVVDLQTGAVLFMSGETGKASGTPQIGLEIAAVGRNIQLNQGAVFSQTVTGKAIEDAFNTIGPKLNKFFDGKIKK